MLKPFEQWNVEKESLEYSKRKIPRVHEREIWWCSLGVNVGHEQDGKHSLFERPVLVIKKFNQHIFWVLPMTSQEKVGEYYHEISYRKVSSWVILSQLRLVSVKRMRRNIGKISPGNFFAVRERVKDLVEN